MALRLLLPCRLFAVVLAAPAHAAPCRVEISGAESPAWRAAAASLDNLALSDRDCLSLRIEITDEGARVVLTTADGRKAERSVLTASDLRPTISALRVHGPAAPEPQEPTPQLAVNKPEPPAREDRRALNPTNLRLALLTGLRGGANSLASPLLMGELALGIGRLELGALLAAEVQYLDLAGTRSADRQSGAATLGLSVGIRQPVASIDLRAGAHAAYARLLTVNRETETCLDGRVCPDPSQDDRTHEWRLGAYAGFVVPRAGTLRFRTDLALDLALPAPSHGDLPVTPGWALSLLLGLEAAP